MIVTNTVSIDQTIEVLVYQEGNVPGSKSDVGRKYVHR